jgi:hypothetical protein
MAFLDESLLETQPEILPTTELPLEQDPFGELATEAEGEDGTVDPGLLALLGVRNGLARDINATLEDDPERKVLEARYREIVAAITAAQGLPDTV